MSANTKIEWCDHTFNPWIGCTKVGPGCDNCYAKADFDDRRHRVTWGAGQARSRTKTWGDPVRWNKQHEAFFAVHGRRQRVFCASLADVFDNEVDPQWRAELFDLILATPNLDWLLLTKRIGNAAKMIADACGVSMLSAKLPLTNVWLGATVINQDEADRDIPKLLATPARVQFLSMEPLLGPVDLMKNIGWPRWIGGQRGCDGTTLGEHHHDDLCGPGLDWVIAGGESGPGARPSHPDWYRSLRDQCAAAGVPFLFKQWGEWAHHTACTSEQINHCICVPMPGEPRTDDGMIRVGKKAAGRLLDGIEHNGFPA